jgi:glycosyltransferase involved in cell wall biosynthesis
MSPAPRRVPRIALVTHGFDTTGGVGTVTRWLRDGLRATGEYHVDVHSLATWSRDRHSRRLAAPGSWLRPSLRGAPGASPEHHWGANAVELEFMRYRPRQELTRALCGYDLVQVVAGAPAWATVAGHTGVPVVLQVASRASWERPQQLAAQTLPLRVWRGAMTALTTRAELAALHGVDAVLVENTAMFDWVRSLGHEHVVKAAPGVDTERFAPARRWRPDGHLLSVCRLSDARKGLDRLIRAYAELVRRRDTVPDLVLAGRGPLAAPVRGLIAHLGLASRVVVRADVTPAELVALYHGASVFLQSSHEEGLGMTVLEAMSCGLPVVSTATAGSNETVLDGVTGWLVPQVPGAGVSAALADRTLHVLSDPGCEFGARARLRCLSLFSSRVALQRFTDVYRDLLRARRSGTDQPVRERLPGERSVLRGRLAPPGVRERQQAQPRGGHVSALDEVGQGHPGQHGQ